MQCPLLVRFCTFSIRTDRSTMNKATFRRCFCSTSRYKDTTKSYCCTPGRSLVSFTYPASFSTVYRQHPLGSKCSTKCSSRAILHKPNLSSKVKTEGVSQKTGSDCPKTVPECSKIVSECPKVGVIFDIDGVLIRGRNVIASANEAIEKLNSSQVPYVYLTNGGCETEEQRARSLEQRLNIKIDPDQVVLSHSPLRILDILHDKNVLVCGQGPVSEIAEMCGFAHVCHVDDIDAHFPELDVNDRKKRDRIPISPRKPFSPIEAVVLMGEPVNWEKSLQIIIDIVLADGGVPSNKHARITRQIPIVAVNTDYLWMSESVNPRLGHGGFLLCLECLFEKLTGRNLEYTTILGKPNLFTYCYTENVLLRLTRKMFGRKSNLRTIYAVGDNPNTDVYGANVYDDYLRSPNDDVSSLSYPVNSNDNTQYPDIKPERMKSILVRTGVFGSDSVGVWESEVNHLHRDTLYRPELAVPTHTCYDVLEAVDVILREEGLGGDGQNKFGGI